MNHLIVALVCWVVFAAALMLSHYADAIEFNSDWVYILFTAPISVPIIIVGIPVCLAIRITRKMNIGEIINNIKYRSKRRI